MDPVSLRIPADERADEFIKVEAAHSVQIFQWPITTITNVIKTLRNSPI